MGFFYKASKKGFNMNSSWQLRFKNPNAELAEKYMAPGGVGD